MRQTKSLLLRRQTGSAAEFAPVLFIFFMMILFPLINLIGYATACATVQFLGTNCAQAAQNSSSFGEALTSVESMANRITGSGFGKFANLSPQGGYRGCGVDLYLIEIDYTNDTRVTHGPNTGLPTAYDPAKIYEFQTRCNFRINPFLNLSGVPGIGSVPIVGRPSAMASNSCRNAEHPEGLNLLASAGGGGAPTGGAGSGAGAGSAGGGAPGGGGGSPSGGIPGGSAATGGGGGGSASSGSSPGGSMPGGSGATGAAGGSTSTGGGTSGGGGSSGGGLPGGSSGIIGGPR